MQLVPLITQVRTRGRRVTIISGIFVLFETFPQPYRDWLWYNPLVHVIALMRSGFYSTYDATFVSVPLSSQIEYR